MTLQFDPKLIEEVAARTDKGLRILVRSQEQMIKDQSNCIGEQDKIITNQEEIIQNLRKQVPPRAFPKGIQNRVKLTRNANWKQSALLGLREGLFYAPSQFLEIVGPKLLVTLGGVVVTVGSIAVWALARPVFLVAGLVGYLVARKENNNESGKV